MKKIRLLSLIILSYPLFTYASCGIKPCDFVQCQPGYHCVNGECVLNPPPEDPCQGVTCQTGYHCEVQGSEGVCVPDTPPPVDPCKDVKCDYLFHCEQGTCVKDPTPCPKELAPGAYVHMNDKPYGQGFDATPLVHGDPEFCYKVHGEYLNDCHLEGWPRRIDCEYYLLNYNCPIWEFSADQTNAFICHDDQDALASCDHYGSPGIQDDPKTPTTGDSLETLVGFEGEPKICGLHRDSFGPNQGYFMIAHGNAYVRACVSRSTPNTCGPWKEFNH